MAKKFIMKMRKWKHTCCLAIIVVFVIGLVVVFGTRYLETFENSSAQSEPSSGEGILGQIRSMFSKTNSATNHADNNINPKIKAGDTETASVQTKQEITKPLAKPLAKPLVQTKPDNHVSQKKASVHRN